MFFFFFQNLYYVTEIQKAFKNICLDKMLSDGYFDMSLYIESRINKEEMYIRLSKQKSKYAILYKTSYPNKDNAIELWRSYFGENNYADEDDIVLLSRLESEAIVYWVYRALKNKEEREEFTKELIANIKAFHDIEKHICFAQGVVYNDSKVEIHFIPSITNISNLIYKAKPKDTQLFFRGHSDVNFVLLPSVMRNEGWKKNESKMYNDLQISCPKDFENCRTHFEKLVEMQHYGLPTRLIDITRNPLVALYFACQGNKKNYGEIVLISANCEEVKYPQSDTVSILSSLPAFPYEKQSTLYSMAEDPNLSNEVFNKKAARLLHEVRLEKPAFHADIEKKDLLRSVIVLSLMNNNRIVKQDGAFILCGAISGQSDLNSFRYRAKGKAVICIISNKERILSQLEDFSINHASLFPEIECVSEYIKDKYSC